jgi:hypothetical protein
VRKHFNESQLEWMIFVRKPNPSRQKGQSYLPSIFSISGYEIDEVCNGLKTLLLQIVQAQKDNADLPQLTHESASEKNSKSEAYWDLAFTTILKSERLEYRPIKWNGKYQIKFLSRRPTSDNYEWLGVQMTFSLSDAAMFVKVLRKVQEEIRAESTMLDSIINEE